MATNDDIRDLVPVAATDFSGSKTSRFRGHSVYEIDGQRFFGAWNRPEIPPAQDDYYITVGPGQEGDLQNLAFQFYGHSKLWWILAVANDIVSPFEEVAVGTMLRYPSLVRLMATNVIRLV